MHGLLRRQEAAVAVHGGPELHAFLGDLAQRPQTPHLKAAGIGKDRPVPAHEPVQPAVGLDHLQPRPEPQVEGVSEHHLGTDFLQLRRTHAFDSAVGAHRHERRGIHGAVGEGEPARPRQTVPGLQFKFHAGEPRAAESCSLSISIASP